MTGSERRPRLVAFDHLRALAIVIIVMGHSLHPWAIDSFGEAVVANIVIGGTALFVFISGFFFALVHVPEFDLRDFLLKRGANVVAPFLSVSVVFFTVAIVRGHFTLEVGSAPMATIASFLGALWRGQVPYGFQLWYIPFISVLFLLSPVFVRYTGWRLRARLPVMLLLFAISLLIHRPVGNSSPFQAALYFAPFYLAGINFCLHHRWLNDWLTGKAVPLSVGVAMFAGLHAASGDWGNFHKAPWVWGGIDLMLIQKTLLIPLLYVGCKRMENHLTLGLRLLADASFCIFFLHVALSAAVWSSGFLQRLPVTGLGQAALLTIASVAISVGVGLAARHFLGRHSRLIVGY